MKKIAILCPDYPPTRSGLADHTWLLAAHLSRERPGEVVVITSYVRGRPVSEHADGVKVLRIVNHWGAKGIVELRRRIERESPDWLIVQYVPHLYGRGGINLALPLLLLWLRLRGRRILLIAHELYIDFPPSPFHIKLLLAAVIQRAMYWLSVLAANCVGVSTEAWAGSKIRNPRPRFIHLPSPSAIDPVNADREQIRATLGIKPDEVVLCFFGTFHESKMGRLLLESLKALLSRGTRAKLLVIGPEYEKLLRLADDSLKRNIMTTGYIDRESVSCLLEASDIFLLPTIDGVSTRRTSLMAALSHALPVVGTDGRLTDEILRKSGALCLAPVEDAGGFIAHVLALADDPRRRRELGERGRRLYEEQFAWSVITRKILEAMNNTDSDL
jgi:glycosyltransferase involved in cell wall biosynthesis